jgi:hypothetical protein
MPAPRKLELSPEDRTRLEAGARRDARGYFRERCQALLKIADGASIRQVALFGLGHRRQPETVATWLNRFLAAGIDGLVQRPRRHHGYPP